jgi:hypothetical protein
MKGYDAWKLRSREDEEPDDDHAHGCRCRDCDPDYHRELMMWDEEGAWDDPA